MIKKVVVDHFIKITLSNVAIVSKPQGIWIEVLRD